MNVDYLRNPKSIYRQSFATIYEEADLSQIPEDIADVVVRLIHACGMTDIVDDLVFSQDVVRLKGLFAHVYLQKMKFYVGILIRNVQ